MYPILVTVLILYVYAWSFMRTWRKRRREFRSPTLDLYTKTASLEHQVGLLPHIDQRVLEACGACSPIFRQHFAEKGLRLGALTPNEVRGRGYHSLDDSETII